MNENDRPPEDYRAFNRPGRRWYGLSIALFFLGLALGLLFTGNGRRRAIEESPALNPAPASQTTPVQPISPAADYDRLITEATKRAMPAVVSVHVTGTVVLRYSDPFFDLFYGPQRRGVSYMGSGVIIDPDGIIITNNHVVPVRGRTVRIDVFLTDGRKFQAKIIRDFPEQDLSVLSIEGKNLPHLELGSSASVEPGKTVLAIGNPFGDQLSGGLSYSEPTVTRGIISATRRNMTVPAEDGSVRYLRNMLQTDADINPGNSGGALIDLSGNLIGVNTVIVSPDGQASVGIGFAIPSDRVKIILDHVLKKDPVGQWYTGISVQDITNDIARAKGYKGEGGAVITKVEDGSPGGRCGLKPGDIIERVNGFAVRTKDEIVSMFRGSVPGETFKIGVFRDGRTVEAEMKLEAH